MMLGAAHKLEAFGPAITEILANKQDRDGALDELDIVERLDLEVLVNQQKCPTKVQTCSAAGQPGQTKRAIDPGILSGYRWLLRRIINDYDSLNSRVEQDLAEQREKDEAGLQQWRNKHSQDILQTETNGNPFKPIHTLLEREQNGHVPHASGDEDHVGQDSPDSSSHTVGGEGEYIPLHSPQRVAEPQVLVINQPQPVDVVIAVKEQFEWKMHKQKRHRLKLLPRSNRTAPASASSSRDVGLPPLKGPLSNQCPWARPSTSPALPSQGWGLGLSLEQVCPPSRLSQSQTLVMFRSPKTMYSSDSDEEDVVCATSPPTNQ